MSLNRIRVAVVGAGYVANHHLAALGSVDFVELVGICDTNLEAARSMAARHSIPLVVADLAELLEQSRPDAVHEIGHASGRGRVGQYVSTWVAAGTLKK